MNNNNYYPQEGEGKGGDKEPVTERGQIKEEQIPSCSSSSSSWASNFGKCFSSSDREGGEGRRRRLLIDVP